MNRADSRDAEKTVLRENASRVRCLREMRGIKIRAKRSQKAALAFVLDTCERPTDAQGREQNSRCPEQETL